ncbi:hypothetical protein EL22_04635 [Halostagnicola sp. A56]|uniref:hypothetical protein n=1 Tax=Halostagnicola sp. A56 TaxID=1495067 RepID=UPI00049F6890|nr:hypothetical protein [Halostagnicola sp. A56]KDE58469.1 hypothetical protein EL22_04635 [Halostagnicola sp. A56]
MTELEIPADADEREAMELVDDLVDIGDVVEVESYAMTDDKRKRLSGEVTGSHTPDSGPAYLELDGQPVGEGSIPYEEIETVTRKTQR